MSCDLEIDRSETRLIVQSWLSGADTHDDNQPESSQQPFTARPARLGLGAKFLPHRPGSISSSVSNIQQKLQKQIRSKPEECVSEPVRNDIEESRASVSTKRKTFADFHESLLAQTDINREMERSEKRRLKKQKQRQRQNKN